METPVPETKRPREEKLHQVNQVQFSGKSYKFINAQKFYFVLHQIENRTFQSFNLVYLVTQVPPTAKIAPPQKKNTEGKDLEPSVSGESDFR